MKTCSTCKKCLSNDMFFRDRSRKDGFRSVCKKCEKVYQVKNAEKRKLRDKERYLASDKKELKAKKKAYYLKNIEKYRELNRLWRLKNPDKVKISQRKYYLANFEKNREKCRLWQLQNPDKSKLSTKKWYLRNLERVKESNKTWRSKNRNKVNKWNSVSYSANREKILKRKKYYSATLSDSYIKQLIVDRTLLSMTVIPKELIELKRVTIQIKRQLKANK